MTDGNDGAPSRTEPEPGRTRPIDALIDVMRRLRDPRTGCPWDIGQSFATIAPYTIEEAYEVADAIERDDLDDLREELGDLLLQVVFHARMAEEAGAFDFDDVARAIVAKMLRRHPHVFGTERDLPPQTLRARWEAEKARERAARRARDPWIADGGKTAAGAAPSALDGVARALPALLRAEKLQRRAARVGFDWPALAPVRAKVDEELAELDAALGARATATDTGARARDGEFPEAEVGVGAAAAGAADTGAADVVVAGAGTSSHDAVEDELGDLLFALVNLARHLDIDAERALRGAGAKFERRFRRVESLAAGEGTVLEDASLEALDGLWERAKGEER